MSLTQLPEEPLAKIAAHLNHTDRLSISQTHPTLARTFSPYNDDFWHDVFEHRYKWRRSQIPPSLTPQPCIYHTRVKLHDYADDYFLHKRVPSREIFPNEYDMTKEHVLRLESTEAPHVKTTRANDAAASTTLLHIAHARSYRTVWRSERAGGFRSLSAGILDGEASALAADSRRVAVGLRTGVVMLRDTTLRSAPWRRMRGHVGTILSAALLDDIVISGGSDRTIRVRRIGRPRHSRGQLSGRGEGRGGAGGGGGSVNVLRGHATGVAWVSPVDAAHVVSHGTADGRMKLWDIQTATCVTTGRVAGGAIGDAVVARTGGATGDGSSSVVYAATGTCVQVLDVRTGLDKTVCTLALPRGWRDTPGGIRKLAIGTDGTLGAAVGGGGVALWDAHGPWEARGVGWPRRWDADSGKTLRALCLTGRAVVAGGGGRELLTFARDGMYEGFVCEDGVRKGGVSDIVAFEEGVVVARVGWKVNFTDVRDADVDWEGVQCVQQEENDGGVQVRHKFWEGDL